MLKLLLLLHLLAAIFAIGPLTHAVTTAARGLRRADAPAIAASARMAKIYSIASVLVVIFGFGLMSQKRRGKELGTFGDTWIWLSLLLWVIALVLTFVVIVPALEQAAQTITLNGGSTVGESLGDARTQTDLAATLKAQTARVAACGGVVGIIFAVIVVLMVYRPGS